MRCRTLVLGRCSCLVEIGPSGDLLSLPVWPQSSLGIYAVSTIFGQQLGLGVRG